MAPEFSEAVLPSRINLFRDDDQAGIQAIKNILRITSDLAGIFWQLVEWARISSLEE